jgi:uncharacterized protein (DUF1330 family)
MTEEDKKEFEEFLEWKKQKKATEGKENSATPSSESIVKTSDEKDKSSQSEVSAAKLSNPSKRDDSSANILLVILGFAIVIAIALIIAFTIGSNSNSTAYADSTEVDTLADEDSFSRYNDDMSGATEGGWSRREETDPMNDSKSVFVSVTSDNTNKLGLPYGDVYATIIVRKMKKYGVDVLIRTSDGQIFGNEYDNENYVTIRFDSNKPIRFYYNTSSDGSSDVVFLRKRAAFIQAAKKANTITVEIPYFQNGRQIFTFTTPKPLDW